MSAAALRVTESFGALIQDLGRVGHERRGINRGGASDTFSPRFANLVVGNADDAAVVEIAGSGFSFTAVAATTISVTGARAAVMLEGEVRLRQWEALSIPAGAHVAIGPPSEGNLVYVAVSGGIAAERLYGSVAPLPPFSFANPVGAGKEISTVGNAAPPLPFGTGDLAAPFVRRVISAERVHVMETKQTAMFAGMERLYEEPFEKSARSDAIGARLSGSTPTRSDHRELVSRSVPIGSIEIPSEGELIALLRGRLITAGYPIPAVIAQADIDLVAQLTPGARVRFEKVGHESARRTLLEQELVLQRLQEAQQ